MPEHYPRNTTAVTVWCNTCNRLTVHRVDDRRLGPCQEHGVEGLSKKQQQRRDEMEQGRLQPGLPL